jgi:hypothetical protein
LKISPRSDHPSPLTDVGEARLLGTRLHLNKNGDQQGGLQ